MKDLEQIKRTLNNYLEEHEAEVEAWQQVKIEKKKNGEEFARLSQALKNGYIGKYYPVEDGLHPYITIYTKTKSGKYVNDSMPIFYYLDELPNTDERKKDLRPQFVRQTTPMTNDEIMNAIKNHINKHNKSIEGLKRDLDNAEKAYNNYMQALQQAEQQLKADTQYDLDKHSSLYYEIKYNK